MTTTTSDMTIEAKAFILATVDAEPHIDIERKVGYKGRTKTVRVEKVRVHWYIDLRTAEPEWRYREKVTGRNVLQDGTLGAPVEVWEYALPGWDRRGFDGAVTDFVAAAIGSTRPATVPTLKIEA